jgi:hypothetical protein
MASDEIGGVSVDCRYTLEQINQQIDHMDPESPGIMKWNAWWIVYDSPDGGIPPPAPSNINSMTNAEISLALYNCYCMGNCP